MSDEKQLTPREALRAIPVEARQSVIDWLDASGAKARSTAMKIRIANRKIRSVTAEATAEYWDAISRTCGLLQSQISTAKPKRRAGDPKVKDEPTIG